MNKNLKKAYILSIISLILVSISIFALLVVWHESNLDEVDVIIKKILLNSSIILSIQSFFLLIFAYYFYWKYKKENKENKNE